MELRIEVVTQELKIGIILSHNTPVGYISYFCKHISDNEYSLMIIEIKYQCGWWN